MRWAMLLPQSEIDEGPSGDASREHIVTSVVASLNRLFRAQDVLTEGGIPSPSERDLAVTADALEAGVREAALLQIQSTSPGEHGVVATAVLTMLVLLGHTPDDALARVQTALSRGPEALESLRLETARQVGTRGIPHPSPPGGEPGFGSGPSVSGRRS